MQYFYQYIISQTFKNCNSFYEKNEKKLKKPRKIKKVLIFLPKFDIKCVNRLTLEEKYVMIEYEFRNWDDMLRRFLSYFPREKLFDKSCRNRKHFFGFVRLLRWISPKIKIYGGKNL